MIFKASPLSPSNVKRYYEYNLSYDKHILRWLGIIGAIMTLPFIYYDYVRVTDNNTLVFSLRVLTFILLIMLAFIGFYKNTKVWQYQWASSIFSTIFFILAFIMDYYSGLPPYFLTNYIFTFLFVFSLMGGHPLLFKICQAIVLLIGFVLYANLWSPHYEFHTGNQLNLVVTSFLILVASWLMSGYRQLNFYQKLKLDEHNKKIEADNRLKTEVLSTISHDFASPVRNLSSLILLYKNQQISSDEVAEYSTEVQKALEGLTTQMDGMLSWTKMNLKGQKHNPKSFDLYTLIDDIIKSFDYINSKKKVEISNEIRPNTVIHTDFEVMQIVLRNFISNALKFSDIGGLVTINSLINEETITVSVIDQGIGMNENQLNNLFSLNTKSVLGTKKEKGSGIGLIICKDFVEFVGGKLSAKSEEGKGSEFTISLPNYKLENHGD